MVCFSAYIKREETVGLPGIVPDTRSEVGKFDAVLFGRALVDGQILDIYFLAMPRLTADTDIVKFRIGEGNVHNFTIV